MPRQKIRVESEFLPITENLLKKLAGNTTFIKGKEYFESGAVIEWYVKGTNIEADVQGNEIYRVTLSHNLQQLSGSCDCRASEGIDFCKHCVAVALLRAEQLAIEAEAKNNPVKKLSVPEKRRAAFREHLQQFNKEKLIEQFIDVIDADKYLRQEWELKIQKSKPVSSTEIRKLITSSIPLNKHLYRTAEVRQYFYTVNNLVNFLTDKLDSKDRQSLILLESVFERLTDALKTVDDSGGYRFDLLENLISLYMQTLKNSALSSQEIAQFVFDLWEKPYQDLLPSIPKDFEHLFDKPAKEHFLQLVKNAWENYRPSKESDEFYYFDYKRSRLEGALLRHAYEQNDFQAVLQIKIKYAKTVREYLDILDACLEFNQITTAREWLEKARRKKDDGYVSSGTFERVEVNILMAEKKPQEAIDVLWKFYQKSPVAECLEAIVDIAKQVKPTKNWEDEAITHHQTQLDKVKDKVNKITHANILVSLLLKNNRPDEALIICEKNEIESKMF